MTGPESEQPDPRRWKALTVTLVAGFMSLLDVSIVSVALPAIQVGLGTGPAGVQWVVAGYALSFGLALVPAGRLGDAKGRRRVFLWALGAFVLCSALVGAAPTTELMIAARLAQGLAAGALAPQNSALIQQLFTGAERGRAFGYFGAIVGISTAVGPVVGGLILAVAGGPDGWRWIFLVNVPVGLVALVLAARLLPARTDAGGRETGHLDLVGVGLLGAGVLATLLPLMEAESGGFGRLWWLFGVGAVLLVGFVVWERRVADRGAEPLLDLRLLTSTAGYASGSALGMIYFAGFGGIWLVLPIFFQTGLGYTPLQSGLTVTSFALGSAVSAVLGGRLVAGLGRRLTALGLGLVMVGFGATALVLAFTPPGAAGPAAAGTLLVAGIGSGLVITPNITLTLRCVPLRMAGSAGGALQTGQRIGAAVGTAALAAVYYAVLGASGQRFPLAVAMAMGAAAAIVLVALGIAVRELRDPAVRLGA